MSSKPLNFALYLVAAIVNLLSFSSGISITWIAPFLQNVYQTTSFEKNPFGRHLSNSEISWIAGLLALGATLGPLAAGKIADKIGRKSTLLIVGTINMVALIITAFAHSIFLFYIARFLAGVALGSAYTVIPVFLAEISENHNRGTLGCSMAIFVSSGANFSLIVGPYVSVQAFSLICLSPLALFLPSFFILGTETPVFLASRKNHQALASSLLKLRKKSSDDIHLEMTSILEGVQQNTATGTVIEMLKNPCLRKTLFISLFVVLLPQAAGIGPILSFMPYIFSVAKVNLPPEICVIIVGSFQVLATLVSSAAVDRIGRRFLLLSSTICVSFNLACLGVYFHLKFNDIDVKAISWMPIVSLVVFIVSFNVGLGSVPWVVMAELFPSNFTSVAASLSTFACFITSFVVVVGFPTMVYYGGMANCFFIFSGVAVAGAGLIWWILPETKGKSLQEIQIVLGAD